MPVSYIYYIWNNNNTLCRAVDGFGFSCYTSDAAVVWWGIIRYASGLLFETRPLRKIFILDDFVCVFFFFFRSPLCSWVKLCHIPTIGDVFHFPIYFPHFPFVRWMFCMHLCWCLSLHWKCVWNCVAMTAIFPNLYTYIYTRWRLCRM